MDVLSRCISQLRHAFDDDPKNPDYILTVPRKGYRLAAPVAARPTEEVMSVLNEISRQISNQIQANTTGSIGSGL